MTSALLTFGSTTYTLHPGDVASGVRGDRLVTLLGSCVAVILTDPRRTVGAMCHIVHSRPAQNSAAPRDSSWGDVALGVMYEQLQQRGITPRMCEAYVYGGGNMFPDLVTGPDIGGSNASWTLQLLKLDGVRVRHQDLGGAAYRRLAWTVGPDEPVVQAVAV